MHNDLGKKHKEVSSYRGHPYPVLSMDFALHRPGLLEINENQYAEGFSGSGNDLFQEAASELLGKKEGQKSNPSCPRNRFTILNTTMSKKKNNKRFICKLKVNTSTINNYYLGKFL